MLHSARTIALLAAAFCTLPAIAAQPAQGQDAPVEREPLLRFDIVEIPREGKVSAVTGSVERLSHKDRWVAVKPGYRLLHGDQLKIGAGATLVIQFSATERAEFAAAPQDRWLQFEIAGVKGHGT